MAFIADIGLRTMKTVIIRHTRLVPRSGLWIRTSTEPCVHKKLEPCIRKKLVQKQVKSLLNASPHFRLSAIQARLYKSPRFTLLCL
ncbi:hypothetical protein ACU8KH_02110 [Lachancea thermotolerans]